MYISKVSLVNYRNFANACFRFNEGINTIIGENGSGKTNLFKAIRLLLEDSFYSFAFKLDKEDFNRKLSSENIDGWKGHWIIISLEFSDISKEESIQSLFIHGAGDLQGEDKAERATYNLYFRPKPEIRHKLSELNEGDKDGLNALLENLTIEEHYETYFTGKSTVDFNDPEVYKELVGDFENVKFSFNIDESRYGIRIPHQLSVSKEISFTFIKALRDVVSDFHNNRKNPLLKLLKNKSGEIKKEDFDPISILVNKLNSDIEGLRDIQSIREDISITINDAVGETYAPSSLSIKSSLSNEAERLLQSLKLFIGEPDESYEGDIHELSLGGANLIFLTLKLLEYKYRKSKDSFANFLLIEEPEAHIHTHIQKTLFNNIDFEDTQIIYSTHSTHISEVSNVENMNILAKKRDYAEVFHPATGLDGNQITKLERYLDAVRTNLLFAKSVMLVEGDAEEILIPIMIKEKLGVSLDELGISLINIRSTGFENVAQLFHEDRVRRKCAILTDLDAAICDITELEGDSEVVKKYKNKVKRSHDKGEERRNELNKYVDGNDWLEVFYADHTFEVDFVKAGNTSEIHKIIATVYKSKDTIEKATEEIKSLDVAVYGKRVLTMAKQEGKGWFAIMLGEHVTSSSFIPNYILEALRFIKPDFSKSLVLQIIKYRIKDYIDVDLNDFNQLFRAFINGDIELGKLLNEISGKIENEVILDDQIFTFLMRY